MPTGGGIDVRRRRLYVSDAKNHRVQVFDSTGRFQFEFGSYGSGEGEFDCLAGVTVMFQVSMMSAR